MDSIAKKLLNAGLPCLLAAAGLLTSRAGAADAPAWIAKSNQDTNVLLEATASFAPEFGSQTGRREYDTKVSDLLPGTVARSRAAIVAAQLELSRRSAAEEDPLVQQDISILTKSAQDQIETLDLNDRLMINYTDVGQLVFAGEFCLLDEQIPADRRTSAVARLKRYVGMEPGTTPITEQAKALYAESAKNPKLIAPYKADIEQQLSNISHYSAGIRKLYAKYGLDKMDGAPAALDAMDSQLKGYEDWMRSTVLPQARADFHLPPEIYADDLKNVGLDISPQELMQKAEVAFAEIRNEMNAIAPLVAKENNFPDPDYRAVIRELKKTQLTRDNVQAWYGEVLGHLEDDIRQHRIVTLPDRAMSMRLASDAETAQQPAPHMLPPPLIGNTGERGTFVLTMGKLPEAGSKELVYDDFTFKAAAWTLTAHEGRPGHELQFSAMVERGVSQARSIFAFNSVNVEGWALYCEAQMKPFEPLDGQLIALQHRLMRATRAFVDPMLNLGLMTRDRAHDILTQDVCLSEALAQEELDRFMFRAPGQATSYFYGYQKLMELRSATEIALGPKFNLQAFNDFLIGQGLLPPPLLAKAVHDQFIPSQLKG
jgi:uncharacterized protein (DUF885 family)